MADKIELGSFDEELKSGAYDPITFSADAQLIRELGERLVGKPHIALAELVKNAFDADATICRITLGPTRIVVEDNGHGMTDEEFREFWMTIGTTNKRQARTSRMYKRPITGSKGVGRLSAQFLAHRMQLFTKSREDEKAVHALVNWDEAVEASELTKAAALYRLEEPNRVEFPEALPTGRRSSWRG